MLVAESGDVVRNFRPSAECDTTSTRHQKRLTRSHICILSVTWTEQGDEQSAANLLGVYAPAIDALKKAMANSRA